jgi:glycosyltransferase involved in cell wall biosynthesis
MLPMTDLLTIALPVYKRTDFVKSALDSCFKQTVPCRVLLIDNNSPHDDFKTILESYNSPLFKYHRNPETVPQDENFNNCFRYAETPYVTILHDDDMLHCQFVELTARLMERFGTDMGGFSVRSHVSENEWEDIYSPKNSLAGSLAYIREPYYYFAHLTPFPGVVVKRKVALDLGGFTNKLFPIADFDFWYRYNQREKMIMVEDILAYYRISSSQSTVDAFYDMINKIYDYRKQIISKGRYNNVLTRLSLEYSRLMNIDYFKSTYQAFNSEGKISDPGKIRQVGKLIKIPLMKNLLWKYMQKLSYDKIR